jgi:hypothetical protein
MDPVGADLTRHVDVAVDEEAGARPARHLAERPAEREEIGAMQILLPDLDHPGPGLDTLGDDFHQIAPPRPPPIRDQVQLHRKPQ